VAHRRRPDSGAQGEGGGREEGEKREEVGEVRLLYLSRAGAEQRGGATGASGGEQRRLRRRCCKAEEGARGGCAGSWRAGVRGVPIYRRGMAVARGGRRWPRRQRRRCRGVAGAVRAQGGGVRCEATRHHGRAATAAGGSVPRSTLLCSVKAGRPWRGRALGSGRRVAWRGAFVRVCALGQVG